MANILEWPYLALVPEAVSINLVPFTRSGGRAIGGGKTAIRTDIGFWEIEFSGVQLFDRPNFKAFDAISAILGGASGRIAVPIYSNESAPFANGVEIWPFSVKHSDGAGFSDGSAYLQMPIAVQSSGVTPIGAGIISLNAINADSDLSGVKFSYNHALYQTGELISKIGNISTVRITPSIRETIPANADLNFSRPTCVCRLADDDSMVRGVDPSRLQRVTVKFQEDTDYWSRLAVGLDV